MRTFTLLLLALFALAANAADVNLGPEYEIRPPRFAAFGQQAAQSIASNGRTFVAIWIDSSPYSGLLASPLDASGKPAFAPGYRITFSAQSPHIASDGNGYLVIGRDVTGRVQAQHLDADGIPIGTSNTVLLSASEILGFVSNGSTYLLAWRNQTGTVVISILTRNGFPLLTRADSNLTTPIAIGVRDRMYVYIDSFCSTNCARIVTISETGELSARTVIGAGLSNSFTRAAFSPDRILLVSAGATASFLLTDYDGHAIAAERLPATAAQAGAGWDGRQFIVFLVDAALGLRGIRVSYEGSLIDHAPFTISLTYAQTSTGLMLVPNVSNGTSGLAVWSDTRFSSQLDVVARPFVSFDDLAASAALMLVTYADERVLFGRRPKQIDVRTAWANGHLLTVWAEPDGIQAALDGTQIDVNLGYESSSSLPVVVAGNESFLVAWFGRGSVIGAYVGRRIGFDGRLLDKEPFLLYQDRFAPPAVRQWSLGHDGTNFVFVWAYGGIRAVRVGEDGKVLDSFRRTIFTYGDRDDYATPALARTSSGLFASWIDVFLPNTLYSTPLTGITASQIRTYGLGDTSISSLSATFAGDRITYAWVEKQCVTIAQFTLGGDLLTTPRALDCASAAAVDLAWNGSEHVVVWTKVWGNVIDPGPLRALRVDRQGNPIDAAPFNVSPARFTFGQPAVTATPEGVTISYTRAPDGGPARVFARTLARLAPEPGRRRVIGR